VTDDPQEQWNRAAIVLAAMLVIFAALLVVVLAWGASSESIGRLEDFAGWLRRHDDGEAKTIVTLGALVIVLAMMSVIIVELTPSPTQRMRVRNVKAGGATITTTEIARRINMAVAGAGDVAECAATVAPHGKRVEVVLDLHVAPGADLARTADEACRRAQALVEEEIGVALAAPPRARLHYRELRLRREPEQAPASESTAPTGWERPPDNERGRDERGQSDTPEEAQA
jgi:hypothetical protein